MSFLHAHVTGEDWQSICQAALIHLGPTHPGADLGFLYIADTLGSHAKDILAYLGTHGPVRHWVGCVASGLASMGAETYETPALSLLVTDIREEQFRIIPSLTRDTRAPLRAHQAWRRTNPNCFGVMHGDPRHPANPRLIAQLSQGLEGGFLVGGLSSSSQDMYVQIADQVSEGGLSGVLFSSDVPVVTGLSQGCALIGTKHRVTDGEGHVIAALDGRPALEVFLQDIGDDLASDLNQVDGLIFLALPVPGSDTGDYLVRNLMGVDLQNNLLAVSETIEMGTSLQFARRDEASARADLTRMLRKVKARLGPTPKGALYVSCLGRGRHLFGADSAELKLIQAELGQLPLTGFFANGEICHNRLYGYTGVLTVFQ